MIKRLFEWLKHNKLLTVLILVVAYFILFNGRRNYPVYMDGVMGKNIGGMREISLGSTTMMDSSDAYYPTPTESAPTPEIQDRMMVTSSNFSLLVKDVTKTLDEIKGKVTELKGYVVNVSISRPELGEHATIQFRVPTEQVETMVAYLRGASVKVVSENVSGHDVTDKYTDVAEYLKVAQSNKTRLEEILASARTIDEIMKVQNQIFSLQRQIDNYKGQMKYMEGTSETSLITAYISTDEIGLPYAEPLSWRPEVIFKHAVRSMIGTLQKLGAVAIWLGVYSVLIVPTLTIILIIIIVRKKKMASKQQQ